MENLGHEPKRRRIEPSRAVTFAAGKSDKVGMLEKSLVLGGTIPMIPAALQQARNLAVAQAQQDGCTGNFRVVDSMYGNFLVPTVPSRSELGG